ncbi:hypothetical protein PsorP6_016267 [Peronosclerospora sorghi]|uniref:Uncharacterized protein n=1 Tax=Peronosclerospora sorghi TaxID=230839 RepID=A0ACC0VLA7_9STRA|nr:hypothetical protein PsorP6_016267 [Peronosclerospora sorghi]
MWRTVAVLVWKNWRVKQRASRFNRGRRSNQWLFPALVTDMVLPLGLLLLLIQIMCQYNALILPGGQTDLINFGGFDDLDVSGTDMDMAMLENMLKTIGDNHDSDSMESLLLAEKKTEHVTLVMTALPLLLAKSNQSLAILDRPESVSFLHYLDRQYPPARELGISSYMELTKILPFDDTMSNEEADKILLEYPEKSGEHIYAALDIRNTTVETHETNGSYPFELVTLFYEKVRKDPSQEDVEDQVTRYFYREVTSNGSLNFPNFLPFQMSLNTFLRDAMPPDRVQKKAKISLPSLPADMICLMISKMFTSTGLSWTTFPDTSPLGQNVTVCTTAVSNTKNLSTETYGFLETFVSNALSGDELATLNVAALPPRPANTVSGSLEGNIVFYTTYLFMWPYLRLIRDVVHEKEKQLKEYLMIMGIPAMALLLSWFLLYWLASSVVALLATFLLQDTMFAATADGCVYFFVLVVAFASSMLLFGLCITPIFNQTKTATACAPLIFFVLSAGSFLRSLVGDETVATSPSWALLLTLLDGMSAPVVFMQTLHEILAFDAVTSALRPITWDTMASPYRVLAMQCAGYLLLGWYLEHVFPRTIGVQHKWYFVFQPSYWYAGTVARLSLADPDRDTPDAIPLTTPVDDWKDDTVREQSLSDTLKSGRPALFLHALSKTYPNGHVALTNVSFGVPNGAIFGLLGPNGAGKSTTLSILSGTVAPSAGDAYIGGSTSVATNPRAVRQSLSVCFQQNVLYDTLTVWEHLVLVCALKASLGVETVAEDTFPTKLALFQLDEKVDAPSRTLSGGQKRKLSLVLALLDHARVLLLDEPTAGMDLQARVDTWDALKRAVSHRAVILTTHAMDEAEALCDEIGIVSNGRLKCCGSSAFLKTQYGVGYKLTLAYRDPDRPHDLETVRQLVHRYVPHAVVLSDTKWDTRVQLTDATDCALMDLFRALDDLKAAKSIDRYAIAATELEDVFVKVTQGEDVYYHANDPVHGATEAATEASARQSSWLVPLVALLEKRWRLAWRDKKSLFAQYVWPLAFFALFVLVVERVLTASGSFERMTALPLSHADATLVVAAAPDALDVVDNLVTRLATVYPLQVATNVSSDRDMLATMLATPATTYFGALYVSRVAFQLYYNESVRHALPVTVHAMAQASCAARRHRPCPLAVTTGLLPLDATADVSTLVENDDLELNLDEATDVMRRIMMAMYVLMAASSMGGHYGTPIVWEKTSGVKRLQYLHLAPRRASWIYWLSHFLYDYGLWCLASSVLAGLLLLSSLARSVVAAWVVSLACLGVALVPAQYLVSLVFASHASAQSYLSYASLFQTLAASAIFTLSMVPGVCRDIVWLTYVLQLLPLYTMGMALLNTVTLSWTPWRTQCRAGGAGVELAVFDADVSVWSWDVAGHCWAALLASGVAYTVLLLLVDAYQMYPGALASRLDQVIGRWGRAGHAYAAIHGRPPVDDNDEHEVDDLNKLVSVVHVSKRYEGPRRTRFPESASRDARGAVVALEDVSLSVASQDCVALLGVNGSGKSTLFKIVTGATAPTRGCVTIQGADVARAPRHASACYGYCPQPNMLFPELSVRDHVWFFRCLGGQRAHDDGRVVDTLMAHLGLTHVAHTLAKHLSGGNQRRLMLALALVRDERQLLLLDEPSAGVDVVARRLLWRVLHAKQATRTTWSCLFTTHSMEEADAVCVHAIVLARGRVVWSGRLSDLKARVGRGVCLHVRVDRDALWHAKGARYVEAIAKLRAKKPRTRCVDLKHEQLRLDELDDAYEACRAMLDATEPDDDAREAGDAWLATVRARCDVEAARILSMRAFVTEWLEVEALVTLERDVFRTHVTARSGEPVVRVRAGGVEHRAVPTGKYETTLTDTFGLVDLFEVLEAHKQRGAMAQYTISELPLERAFEHLTK